MKTYKLEKNNSATAATPFVSARAENIRSVPHYHKEIEAIRCDRGEMRITAYNSIFVLKEGEIMFFMPYEIHSIISGEGSEAIVMKIHSGVKNIAFSRFVLKDKKIDKSHKAHRKMSEIIDVIKRENMRCEAGYEIATAAKTNELLLCLVRDVEHEEISKEEGAAKLKNVALLEKLSEYLEENYTGMVTLEAAAKSCNMSKFYFCRSFKEITGMSFIDYLSAYRIKKAVELTETTDFSHLEIALSVGFNNYQSYLRAFKKIYKKPPKKYFS